MATLDQQTEAVLCAQDPTFFIERYVQLESVDEGRWMPFNPWPAQRAFLDILQQHQFVIALKARQVGFTWITLGYGLHGQLFRPIYPMMAFSRREREALDLVRRTIGMAQRLPRWLMPTKRNNDSSSRIEWDNGSWLGAYSSSGGDAQTARLVLVDEAGLQPDLDRLLRSVEPVVEHTGQLVLIGRIDKDNPGLYGRMCQAAMRGDSRYAFCFIPWWGRPDRTDAWYDQVQAEALALDGTLDAVLEQYPATAEEALRGKSLNKRLAPAWFRPPVYERRDPIHVPGAPALPGARYYVGRDQTHRYVVGVDPAEGNPQSDYSAIMVQDDTTGEYVAVINQRLEPDVTADYALQLARYYGNAGVMVERNNHGHAVLQRLLDVAPQQALQAPRDLEVPWQAEPTLPRTSRFGWLNNRRGKMAMYTGMAEALRGADVRLYDQETMEQLASIDGNRLRAPDGQHDDLATAAALCQVARETVASRPRLGVLTVRRSS
ncbi:MAG: hypothetical protein ACOX3S_15755 [Anaerolineae bacterium]|jgi:hypothetical protein